MASFSPPTDEFVSWSDSWDNGILSYLRPGPRGRNVFKLTDGNYTENQPATNDEVQITYHGGHIYPVSAQEEADLIEAGYGDFITP